MPRSGVPKWPLLQFNIRVYKYTTNTHRNATQLRRDKETPSGMPYNLMNESVESREHLISSHLMRAVQTVRSRDIRKTNLRQPSRSTSRRCVLGATWKMQPGAKAKQLLAKKTQVL
ncbi:hypothetical protein E4U21_005795 [Claviceps maximensis]|nr:hypothetical protein E4U21_005795 [Claviceps maximensis]